MVVAGGFCQFRDILAPVPPGQQKEGYHDNPFRPRFDALFDRLLDRRFSQLHVRGPDIRVSQCLLKHHRYAQQRFVAIGDAGPVIHNDNAIIWL